MRKPRPASTTTSVTSSWLPPSFVIVNVWTCSSPLREGRPGQRRRDRHGCSGASRRADRHERRPGRTRSTRRRSGRSSQSAIQRFIRASRERSVCGSNAPLVPPPGIVRTPTFRAAGCGLSPAPPGQTLPGGPPSGVRSPRCFLALSCCSPVPPVAPGTTRLPTTTAGTTRTSTPTPTNRRGCAATSTTGT